MKSGCRKDQANIMKAANKTSGEVGVAGQKRPALSHKDSGLHLDIPVCNQSAAQVTVAAHVSILATSCLENLGWPKAGKAALDGVRNVMPQKQTAQCSRPCDILAGGSAT